MSSLSLARGVAYLATAVVALAIPATSLAATYAYVNTSGIVATTDASDGTAAMATAPYIRFDSGVVLLNDASDWAVVGYHVPGM